VDVPSRNRAKAPREAMRMAVRKRCSAMPRLSSLDRKMQTLEVEGPYEVPYDDNERGAKHVTSECGRIFFDVYDGLSERRGCYIFAIRNRGLRAGYVGKATKGFGQEVFAADKLQKFNTALHEWPHGTPVLLFVLTPPRVHSSALITDVEEYLIRSAKRAWPDVLNKHHTGPDDWEISGVTVPHAGRRSGAEADLVRLLKFEDG
jgi:hypothetical protein